jgi:putative membrane protein
MNKNIISKIMRSAPFLAAELLSTSPALAQPGRYGDWHMGQWMMGDWGVGWFGMIFMLVFWALVIGGVILLIRWLAQSSAGRGRSGPNEGSKAVDILKERYARGEISRDQFESMKKDLLE